MNIDYNNWKNSVNNIVFNNIGYHCDNLEDYLYADSYNNSILPTQVANTIISIFKKNQYNNFNVWKYKVNTIIKKHIGKDCDEIDDFNYIDCYNEELSPHQVAYHILQRYN